MSYPNITQDIQELQELQAFQANLINLVYPVGSIYMSVNNVSPQTFLGGTWEQIQDTFLLSAGSKHTAGSSGGEETHTLTQSETPAHTHTRGTMNITGSFNYINHNPNHGHSYSGAFNKATIGTMPVSGISAGGSWVEGWGTVTQSFTASNNWTGSTSSVGGNAAHNNMPPYLTVYMWKRTA